MPPTNATRSSMTIVFSWWQCIGRSWASRAHWIRVPRRARSRIARTSRRDGRNIGSGAPAHAQHPHVDPLRELGEQIAQRSRVAVALEREVGREVPAGDVDVRARASSSSAIARQRLGAVDQHLERVAVPQRGCAVRPNPPAGGSSACSQPSVADAAGGAGEFAPDRVARPPLDTRQAGTRHRHGGQRRISPSTTRKPRLDTVRGRPRAISYASSGEAPRSRPRCDPHRGCGGDVGNRPDHPEDDELRDERDDDRLRRARRPRRADAAAAPPRAARCLSRRLAYVAAAVVSAPAPRRSRRSSSPTRSSATATSSRPS